MDIDLRIILLAIGALFIIGLILIDRIKRKNREDMPYKRFSESDDFELPSMSSSKDAPSHDELDELRVDEIVEPTFSEPMMTEDEVVEASQIESDDVRVIEPSLEEPQAEPEPEVETEIQNETSDEVHDEAKNEPEPEPAPGMVLSLLVLAPKGEQFRGSQIKMALKETGFSYGDMNIFHQMDGDESLVSVANVLEPGTFELDDIAALQTPGLVVFAQLPATHSGAAVFERWYKSSRKLKAALSARLTDMRQQPLAKDEVEKLLEEAKIFAAISRDSEQD